MDKCADNLNECGGEEEDDFPLTRERLDSVSNVEKDAMDEYLGADPCSALQLALTQHPDFAGTNNSQHEEELSKYFHTNGDAAPDLDQTNKLSTLRQLLEQNGISEKRAVTSILPPEPVPPFPTLPPFLQSLPTRRRVSFETPPEDAVPPSPSAQTKNFSFTPISPGPHSPTHSSTSASPFVSPRNTPLPRTKHIRVKAKKELELSLDMKCDAGAKSYMAMSAPVSPMLASGKCNLLQKLLNANSKVQYTPEYAQPPGAGEEAQFFPPDVANRSQSVPLSQMIAGAEFRPLPDSAVNVKSLLSLGGDASQLCDNNNDTFNLDMSSNNQCLMEYGLNLINTCAEAEFSQFGHKLRNITRSHSMDVDSSGAFDVNKCRGTQMALSAPAPGRSANKNFLGNSRSYPSTPLNSTETFIYQVSSDCLINGAESTTESLDFMPNFEIGNSDTGVGQMDGNFGLMDDSAILIPQGFNGNIN